MRAAVVDALRPAGMWTDPNGVVHIRAAGTGHTFCRAEIGPYADVTATSACGECVNVSLHEYARGHVCGQHCTGQEDHP